MLEFEMRRQPVSEERHRPGFPWTPRSDALNRQIAAPRDLPRQVVTGARSEDGFLFALAALHHQ